MDPADLDSARTALRKREGIPEKNQQAHVGVWTQGSSSPATIFHLERWALARGIDHVVWTALPAKFDGQERAPLVDEVVQYLSELTGTRRDHAERYVRLAPRQIDTRYCRRIEADLGWHAGQSLG